MAVLLYQAHHIVDILGSGFRFRLICSLHLCRMLLRHRHSWHSWLKHRLRRKHWHTSSHGRRRHSLYLRLRHTLLKWRNEGSRLWHRHAWVESHTVEFWSRHRHSYRHEWLSRCCWLWLMERVKGLLRLRLRLVLFLLVLCAFGRGLVGRLLFCFFLVNFCGDFVPFIVLFWLFRLLGDNLLCLTLSLLLWLFRNLCT